MVGLMALPNSGLSQAGLYLNAGAGVSIAEKVNVNKFGVPTSGVKADFDPGVRLSVAGGYSLNKFLGAELETGFIYNSVKSVTGAGSVDASLSHVPIIANVVLRYEQPDVKWVPYAGAGAGGDLSILTLDNVGNVDGTSSSFEFAWQAFAGVRYKLNEKMSIGAGYKYYSVDNATWDVDVVGGGTVRDAIKIGKANSRSFLLDFNFRF